MSLTQRAFWLLVLGTATSASLLAGTQGEATIQRAVYVVATDQRGAHIADLTTADLTLKESGKDRQIVKVEHSRARLKVAFAVDEILSGESLIRRATLRFQQQIQQSGDMALFLVGRRSEKRVDYSSEFAPFLDAVNAFPSRPQYRGNLVESLFEIAKSQRLLEGRRAIVALAPEIPQSSNVTAEGVFDQLRDSRSVFYAATLTGINISGGGLFEMPNTRIEGGDITSEVERDRVLSNGTKQSGGLRLPTAKVENFSAALDRVSGDLLNQYVVTYEFPAAAKSDGSLSIETKRKGVIVRGPSRVPKLP